MIPFFYTSLQSIAPHENYPPLGPTIGVDAHPGDFFFEVKPIAAGNYCQVAQKQPFTFYKYYWNNDNLMAYPDN